jgi:hypothetical protein
MAAVLAEAYIFLLRKLSTTDTWSRQVERVLYLLVPVSL